MPVRQSFYSGLVLMTMLTAGCGLPERFAMIRQLETPPALSQIPTGVQPFASAEAGMNALTRNAIQDALFAAQAGNRDRTLLALRSAQAILANMPTPPNATLTAPAVGQMITDLRASTISAQGVADKLQASLPELGAAPTVMSEAGNPPGTVCCWGSPTGLGDEKPGQFGS